jgi:hypothetical protein
MTADAPTDGSWPTCTDPVRIREAVSKVDRLLLLLTVHKALAEATKYAPILGSLLDPPKAVREFLAEYLPRDPPLFREWVGGEVRRYIHLRARFGVGAKLLQAFLEGEQP